MHFCRISACASVGVDFVGGKDADDDDDDSLRALFGDLEGDLGRSAGLRGARAGIIFGAAAGADICEAKSRKKRPKRYGKREALKLTWKAHEALKKIHAHEALKANKHSKR